MFAHCKIKYGEAVVVAKYDTDVDLVTYADFKTGDINDNIGGKNGVYTGTAVNGSTDGTVEKNYKTPVIEAINKVTDCAISNGVEHNGVIFKIEMTDQINALGLMVEMLGGASLNGRKFRAKGITYVFQDNADFLTWFGKAAQLITASVEVGADLKDQVASAANTEGAMAPIIAANNAR